MDNDYSDSDNYKCGYVCDDSDEGIASFYSAIESYVTSDPNKQSEGLEAVREFYCEGEGHKIFDGDMHASGSSVDPSFWPIHPSVERLYHAKLMVGGFDDSTYPSDDDLSNICTSYECYNYLTGVYGADSTCCDGHYAYSQLFDFYNNDRTSGYGPTVMETLNATDPTSSSYSMSYVYDSFSWSHCLSDGDPFSDIDTLLSEFANASE